jgi:hypothetical protein
MYKVDVTGFRQIESEEGFPVQVDDETKAWELFHQTVAGLYSGQSGPGSYLVTFYTVGTGGDVPSRAELVNVPRK